MKFIYTDNKSSPPVILLEVIADDILIADSILKKEKKIDPVKCPWVGCRIEENPT